MFKEKKQLCPLLPFITAVSIRFDIFPPSLPSFPPLPATPYPTFYLSSSLLSLLPSHFTLFFHTLLYFFICSLTSISSATCLHLFSPPFHTFPCQHLSQFLLRLFPRHLSASLSLHLFPSFILPSSSFPYVPSLYLSK